MPALFIENFNYSRSLKLSGEVLKYRRKTQFPNTTTVMSVTNYESGFWVTHDLLSYIFSVHYFDTNQHKFFDYYGTNFMINSPFELFSKFSTRHLTVSNNTLIVYLQPQQKIIDESIKGYEVKRFEVSSSSYHFGQL
jgi:hypothetical protein